jgi:hypothetical protein
MIGGPGLSGGSGRRKMDGGVMGWLVVFVAGLAAASPRTAEVRGRVVDEAGAPVSGVTVFAVDWGTGAIGARVPSDTAGAFCLAVPRRRHQLEADGPGWWLLRREALGGELRLVMRRQPPLAGRAEVAVSAGGQTGGRVTDESGAAIRGVRLTLVDGQGRTVAVADSDRDGRFGAAVPPGRYALLLFAPGLTMHALASAGPNRWRITLAVEAGLDTVRIEAAPPPDPDNPDSRERARRAFAGRPVSNLPRITPTLAELQASRMGTVLASVHPVALQPLGAYCLASSQCGQANGPAVCCASDGELTDEYLWAGGRSGACKPARQCPGARKLAR